MHRKHYAFRERFIVILFIILKILTVFVLAENGFMEENFLIKITCLIFFVPNTLIFGVDIV